MPGGCAMRIFNRSGVYWFGLRVANIESYQDPAARASVILAARYISCDSLQGYWHAAAFCRETARPHAAARAASRGRSMSGQISQMIIIRQAQADDIASILRIEKKS